jgi:hypothetical protein
VVWAAPSSQDMAKLSNYWVDIFCVGWAADVVCDLSAVYRIFTIKERYMNGQDLYQIYVDKQLELNNCQVDEWDQLDLNERKAWDAVAIAMTRLFIKAFG